MKTLRNFLVACVDDPPDAALVNAGRESGWVCVASHIATAASRIGRVRG
jgi:hypothetical protein